MSIDIQLLIAQGYRRISNKHGMLSRIDRYDWKEFLASEGYYIGPQHEGSMADQYRRVYSKDVVELDPEIAKEVPSSGHDAIGFVDKEPPTVEELADRYIMPVKATLAKAFGETTLDVCWECYHGIPCVTLTKRGDFVARYSPFTGEVLRAEEDKFRH